MVKRHATRVDRVKSSELLCALVLELGETCKRLRQCSLGLDFPVSCLDLKLVASDNVERCDGTTS